MNQSEERCENCHYSNPVTRGWFGVRTASTRLVCYRYPIDYGEEERACKEPDNWCGEYKEKRRRTIDMSESESKGSKDLGEELVNGFWDSDMGHTIVLALADSNIAPDAFGAVVGTAFKWITDNYTLTKKEKDLHDWQLVGQPGMYDDTYQCSKCGAVHTERADNIDSKLPRGGCDG